jgi:succinoglycan biosynthesis transport protein ExoP
VPQFEQQLIASRSPDFPASPTLGDRFDFALAFIRRRYLIILVSLLLSVAGGALYLRATPPTYTATATMMIETRKSPLQESLLGNVTPDAAWVESQIGVLKSQNVAAYVVKQLRLADDPNFIRPEAGLLEKLLTRLGLGDELPQSEAERVAAAIGAVSGGLDVRRVGQSYMLRIDFHSQNPEQATKVANALIDGYIFDQLNSKYQANRRAGDWLQERLQALREQAASAERAVVEFKAKNNIVAAGGTLMNEKQLSGLSEQVARTQAQTSDLQARLERIQAVRRAYQQDWPGSGSDADETVTEAMGNPIITKYRTQYLDLQNREADWAVRYGKNHASVVNLRRQIRDIRKNIWDELGRIEETAKSEYGIAKKRQEELGKELTSVVSQSTDTNQAQVALFSLVAAAQSYRKLYDNFLQRHTETIQQQTYPISDARQVSAASVSKTSPKTLQVWIVTILAGGMLGVGAGAFREIMDRGFRTREQVRSVLDTECLALIPLLPDKRRNRLFGSQQFALQQARKAQPAISHAPQIDSRSICGTPRMMQTIIDSPSSPFAEALRSIKLTVDLNREPKSSNVIGLTSCVASEGKSTLAAATAGLFAQSGARVILLDCDLRHPSLSQLLAPGASAGFVDVVAGNIDLADAVWRDPNTSMEFLPAGTERGVANATDILTSSAAKSLFDTLQIKYDYVIVDLSPLVASVDVRATSTLIDSYVLVIEWGTTKIDAVQYALRNAPGVQANIVGAVLNKVNMAAMGRYDSHGANYYYGHPRQTNSVH